MLARSVLSRNAIYFVQCARLRSFSKAAKALHVSQSALSIAIKNFETELGFSLFERGRGQGDLRLTKEAESLEAYLQAQIDHFDRGLSDRTEPGLKVACIPYFSRKYLMKALRDCGLITNTNVFHVRADKALDAIKSGSIDVAFLAAVSRPLKDRKRCIEIKTEDVAIVGLKSAFPHLEKVKRPEQLKDEPWVIGDRVYNDWPNCLSHLKRGFYVEDHFSARFLVLDGHGIAPFQLDYFTKDELSKLALARIRMPSMGLKLYVLLRKGMRKDVALKASVLIDRIIMNVGGR